MPAEDVALLRRRFVALSAQYEARLGERRAHIVLKRDHSLRVHALATAIARAEAVPDLQPYRIAALVHDIGRFPQFEQYGTYRDDQSADHGDLGAEMLEGGDFLDGIDAGLRLLVATVVRLHNKRDVPVGLDSLTHSVLTVVRDADKLDIVPVVLSKLQPGGPRDEVVTLGLRDAPGGWSPDILEAVERGGNPSYSELRFINDFKLLLASWGPKLVHAASRKMYLRRHYLDQLFALLPESRDFGRVKKILLARLQVS